MASRPPPTHPGVPGNPPKIYPSPVPGVKILPPRAPPSPGQNIVGYELYPARANCSCEGLSTQGVVSMVVLILLFWLARGSAPRRPLFWIPLVMDDCFEATQRPVYDGQPGAQGAPVASVNQPPPHYQGQAPPYYQGQGPPQYQGQGPPQYQGQPAMGQPVGTGSNDFPDPVKPPKTV